MRPCCEAWDRRYGCHHEICPGCFCTKAHSQIVCNECHDYNRDHEPYLAKYGPNNERKDGMTPVPYRLHAVSTADGKMNALLTYGATEVASVEGIEEKKLEKWARTEAAFHKDLISPSETFTRRVEVNQSIVL